MRNKKVVYFLLLVISVIAINVSVVRAEGLFTREWGITNARDSFSSGIISTSKGTLVLGMTDSFEADLTLYNLKGEKLYSKKASDIKKYVAGYEKDGYFYIIGLTNGRGLVVIDKYSEKLKLEDSIETGYDAYDNSTFSVNIKDNILYLLNNHEDFIKNGEKAGYILSFNMNKASEVKVVDGEDFDEMYPIMDQNWNTWGFDFFQENVLALYNNDSLKYRLVYNDNYYNLKAKEYYVDATVLGGYVLGLVSGEACWDGPEGSSPRANSEVAEMEQFNCAYVDVYDSSMNFIERIDVSNGDTNLTYVPKNIKAVSSHQFVVTAGAGDVNERDHELYVAQYTLPYNVETKTDGHGTIKVSVKKALSGTVVTFTITPEKGYVLDVVKVTDEYGKVVYFKDYTFTMPSADVLVEAKFIKEVKNPETSSRGVILFASFITLGGILLLTKYIIDVKRYQ